MTDQRRMVALGAGPALLLAAIALPMALYWGDLPDPMAVHWDLSGSPDGSAPPIVLLVGFVMVYAGVWWSVLRAIVHSPGEAGAFTAGLYAIGGLLAGIAWFAVLANRRAAEWRLADGFGWFEILFVLGDAALAGAVGWLLAGGRGPAVPAVRATAPRLAVDHPEQVVWSGRGRSRLLVAAGLALVVAGIVVWGWATLVLVIVGLLVLSIAEVRATVGFGGVTVSLGWLGFPSWVVPIAEISGAGVEQVYPMAYGGWGYRVRSGVRAVIARGGDGLRLQRRDRPDLLVTVDDAVTGAGLVNDLVGMVPSPSEDDA